MSITKHIGMMSEDQLWVSADRTSVALDTLPNPALRILAELTLSALVAELNGRLLADGRDDLRLALVAAYSGSE